MIDREFSEVDLRRMLEYAADLREDVVEGRWIVEARHEKHPWEVIVESDFDTRTIVVVTAYPVE
jgi:hypothetical protein